MENIQITESQSKEVNKKVVGTYIHKEVYEKLKTEAEENFMSVSDLLRKIIYLYIGGKK